MSRHAPTSASLALGLGLALMLAGCSLLPGEPDPDSGGAGSDASDDAERATPAETLTGCVAGEWNADVQQLVTDLASVFSDQGLSVTSATATGTQHVSIDEAGTIAYTADVVYQMTIDASGLAMSVTQHHSGTMSADWAWSDDAETSELSGTMVFENFSDDDYHVDSSATVGGQVSDHEIPELGPSAGDVPMLVACEDDTMSTHPEGTPFTTNWARIG